MFELLGSGALFVMPTDRLRLQFGSGAAGLPGVPWVPHRRDAAILRADSVIHRGGASSPINWCSTPKDQLAQEIGVRASVHRRLQLFDAVHGAFDRAGVVVQGQPGDHGVQVAVQPGGERTKRGQVGVDLADPTWSACSCRRTGP